MTLRFHTASRFDSSCCDTGPRIKKLHRCRFSRAALLLFTGFAQFYLIGAAAADDTTPRAPAAATPEIREKQIELIVTLRRFVAVPEFEEETLTSPEWLQSVTTGFTKDNALRGDLNGDGRDEIIIADAAKNVLHVFEIASGGLVMTDIPIRDGTLPERARLAVGDFDGDSIDDIAVFDLQAHQLTLLFVENGAERIARSIDTVFPALRNVYSLFTYKDYPEMRSVLVFYMTAEDYDDGGGQIISYRFTRNYYSPLKSIGRITKGYVPIPGVALERDGQAYLSQYSVRNILQTPDYRKGVIRNGQIVVNIPIGYQWRRVFSGDFNGDRRQDLIFEGKGIQGSWMAVGSNGYLIEQPLPQRLSFGDGGDRSSGGDESSDPKTGDVALTGNFDGDTFTDFAVLSPDNVRILHSTPGPPIANREIVFDDGTRFRTGEDGKVSRMLSVAEDTVEVPLRQGRRRVRAAVVPSPSESLSFLMSNELTVRFEAASLQKRAQINLFLDTPLDRGQAASYGELGKGPYICNGYRPIANVSKWGREVEECPPDYLVVEMDDSRHLANVICCRAPAPDILTGKSEFIDAHQCPDGSVVTGTKQLKYEEGGATKYRRVIRCTGINAERYVLGPPVPGVYWGAGMSAGDNELGIDPRTLEGGLRIAVGRSDFENWDLDGCIGSPPGALLVTNSSHDCEATLFRTLYYRDGTYQGTGHGPPVVMFRRCRTTPNRFDPLAGCDELPAESGAAESATEHQKDN